jgi:hypothetical protein
VSAPFLVDLQPPFVEGLTITRVTPWPPAWPTSANDSFATLTFTVRSSLSCVSLVQYTVSTARDGTDTDAYLFDPRTLGDAGTSQPPAVGGGATDGGDGTATPAARLGWTGAKPFVVEVRDAALVHNGTYYGVVRVVGCTAVEGIVASEVGLVVDTSPPVFDMGDGSRDVLFLYARPTLMYANFLQVHAVCASWRRAMPALMCC